MIYVKSQDRDTAHLFLDFVSTHFLAGNTLGAVTQVSDILALNGISIFYLSTFDDDFILVRVYIWSIFGASITELWQIHYLKIVLMEIN